MESICEYWTTLLIIKCWLAWGIGVGVLTKNTYVGIVELNEGHDSGTSNLA